MEYESLKILVAPVTIMALAILKMWRDSARTKEVAELANQKIDGHMAECSKKEGDEKVLYYRVVQLESTVKSLEDTTKQNHRQVMDRLTEMAGPGRLKSEIPHGEY